MEAQQQSQGQASSPARNDPHSPHEEISEHALSSQLRELAEEDIKSALVTENPQRTVENASKVERESANNPALANSELIQLPVQQFIQQQQAPLRLSTPLPRQPNFIQTGYPANQQQLAYVSGNNLRASLPANAPVQAVNSQVANQGSNQYFSGWIAQPVTTQARMQTNAREFPVQPQQQQTLPRVPVNMQSNQNQNRPSSASPQRVIFNYNPSQKNIPQPQPQPQPVIVAPYPQPQPVIVYPQPPQPLPPRPIDSSAQFILPVPQQEVVLWQQRYFLILEKFQYYYTRIEIIHKKCIYLDQAILQTKKTEQLQLLKAESEELLSIITSTEQELTETMHRNRELLTQATNWKQKYDQLAKAYEALKQSQAATTKELTNKVELLQRQLTELESNYNQIVKKNEEEVVKNQKLQQEVVALNNQLKNAPSPTPANYQQFQLQYKEMGRIIEEKNSIILGLRKALEEKSGLNTQPSASSNAVEVLQREIARLEKVATDNSKVITNLQEENKNLRAAHQAEVETYESTITRLEKEIATHQQVIVNYETEIKNYLAVIENKTSEIGALRQNLSPSSPRNSDIQIENRRLKHELTIYQESHSSDIKIFNGKIQELVDKIKMISGERDSTVGGLQEKATILESDLNRKDGTIRNLRDRVLELEQEKRIRQLDRKYQNKRNEDVSRSQQVANLRREVAERNNEAEELQAQLAEYKRITNEYEDTLRAKKHEINALKRELEDKSQGVQDSTHLNEQIAKKNTELTDLRNKLVELQKTSNQNQTLRQENIQLNESLRKKHTQLTEAADKLYFLEKRLRELESNGETSPRVIHLTEELQLLESANAKKDQEISKLRQKAQLLQTNADQLQLELDTVRGRLSAGEKSNENERTELKGKVSVLELRVVEHERKIGGLEEVRAIMTEQINTLTAQIHIKYENQQRLELQLKQERARGKAYEAEMEAQLIETEEARVKVREWERKWQAVSKELEAELQRKKDLSNTKKNEMFNLNNKYVELENTLKSKEAKIKQLEKTVESLNAKIRAFDHNIEEMEYLKHKITEYEQKISYQNHKFAAMRLPDLEPTQVFERKVIYQLKVENEALRRQLGLSPKPEGREANIPERDTPNNTNVNQRLNDFNKKLEEVISEHAVVDFNLTGDELYRRMQRDRRLLIQKHNEEISQLKVKILELQSPSLPKKYNNISQIFNEQLDFYREKNLELEHRVESHIKVNRELKESIEMLLRAQSADSSLAYYKEQLEKANDTIVSLQKHIKKGNEELKKLKEDASRVTPKQLADSNVIQIDSKVLQLTRKITQLTLEVNLLEKDKVGKEEALQKSEGEAKRLKAVIDELKSSRDDLQRALKERENTFQDELTKTTNRLRISQTEIERLNEMISKRQQQEGSEAKSLRMRLVELQEENKKLKTKAEELIIGEQKSQREIAKLENKIQVLLAETQRLKEIADGVGKRHREGDVELQTLRMTISEYETKFKSLESQRETFAYRENQLQQEIARLTSQVKMLQTEIDRMSEFTQKKVTQKDIDISRLKTVLNEKVDHCSRLEDQIREMKVLSFKSNDTAQEIFNFKEEINNLKITLGLKTTESDNRLREIYELNDKLRFNEEQWIQTKRNWESKNIEMQGVISSLQSQLSDVRKSRESSSTDTSRVVTLEEQLRTVRTQKDQEIMTLKTRISMLESQTEQMNPSYELQITEFRSTVAMLRQQVEEVSLINNNLDNQLGMAVHQNEQLRAEQARYEEIIAQLRLQVLQLQQQLSSSHGGASQGSLSASQYSIQYLRSILIEVEVLLSEEGAVRYQVLQRVQKQVESGLEECRRWNESIISA